MDEFINDGENSKNLIDDSYGENKLTLNDNKNKSYCNCYGKKYFHRKVCFL